MSTFTHVSDFFMCLFFENVRARVFSILASVLSSHVSDNDYTPCLFGMQFFFLQSFVSEMNMEVFYNSLVFFVFILLICVQLFMYVCVCLSVFVFMLLCFRVCTFAILININD